MCGRSEWSRSECGVGRSVVSQSVGWVMVWSRSVWGGSWCGVRHSVGWVMVWIRTQCGVGHGVE